MNLLVIVLEESFPTSSPQKCFYSEKKYNQEHVILQGIWYCSSCWSKFISVLSTVKKGTLCKCEIKKSENIFISFKEGACKKHCCLKDFCGLSFDHCDLLQYSS